MRRFREVTSLAVVVAVSLWFAGGWTLAQEKGAGEKGTVEKPATKAVKEPAPAKESPTRLSNAKRRLPRYYGKLGLSEAQREKIYGVQDKHAVEIEKLEKQLADLKEKQDAECRKVLSADQKKQLNESLEAAKSRSKGKDEGGDEMEG